MSDKLGGYEALGSLVDSLNINLGSAKNGEQIDFSDAVELGQYATGEGASLPSFTKKTNISSSVYIQRACFDDEVLTDVLQCAQQLYISWILTAVNLNGCLAGSKTLVKDAINVIATEDFTKPLNRYHINSKDIIKGIENFGAFKPNPNINRSYVSPKLDATNTNVTNVKKDKATQLKEEIALLEAAIRQLLEKIIGLEEELKEKQHANRDNDPTVVDDIIRLRREIDINKRKKNELEKQKLNKERELEKYQEEQNKIKSYNPDKAISGASVKDPISEGKLPVGRIVELTLASPNGEKQKINVIVNIYPQILPNDVVHDLFRLNKVDSLQERWFKVKTGELKFWKDFVFELDKAKEESKAIKKDSSGLLQVIKSREHNKLFKLLSNVISGGTGLYLKGNKGSLQRNIINNIIIVNKNDFNRWCKEININFNMENNRNAFMTKCMCMMFIVLDPDFQTVDMYYHGIKYKSEFTYKQISGQSKSEKYDLLSLMKAFNNVNAPKF